MDGVHAFCIGAISSGSGKTTLALGLMRALSKTGVKTVPFKCGPDYIDPEFHAIAAGAPSVNLDLWMMGEEGVRRSFLKRLSNGSCAVVEGVMGAFDGVSPSSIEGSSASLAISLGIPMVLVVDASGMAGTIAALVSGCANFHPKLKVAGVIANFVSTESHKRILAEALQSRGLPPLLGCLPRNPGWELPERHLGLVPEKESLKMAAWYDSLAEGVEKGVDLEALLKASVLHGWEEPPKRSAPAAKRAKLALAMDDAFHFYYQDNLDALEERGVELLRFSPMNDASLPAGADGLYIGGGFPEVFAERLSKNVSMRKAVMDFAEAGMPVYAECGGLMYLCSSIQDSEGVAWDMCGVFKRRVLMGDRLHKLGYRESKTLADSFLGPAGTRFRGHEFHWSRVEGEPEPGVAEAKGLRKGSEWAPSAFAFKRTFASYVHAHFAYNEPVLEGIGNSLSFNGLGIR